MWNKGTNIYCLGGLLNNVIGSDTFIPYLLSTITVPAISLVTFVDILSSHIIKC